MLGKCIMGKLTVFPRQTGFGTSGSAVSFCNHGVFQVGLNCFSSGLHVLRVCCQSAAFLLPRELTSWNSELSFRALAFGKILLPGTAMTHLVFALGYTVAHRQVTAHLFTACLLC